MERLWSGCSIVGIPRAGAPLGPALSHSIGAPGLDGVRDYAGSSGLFVPLTDNRDIDCRMNWPSLN